MSDTNKGALTKADVILMRMDKLTQQMTSVEEKVNAALKTKDSSAALMKKLDEQGRMFKEEMHFLSAQLESVFSTIDQIMSKLSDDVAAIKVPAGQNLDVDDLSSRVAAKIIIPETATADIDENKLARDISSRLTMPETVNAEVDHDVLARRIAALLPDKQPAVVAAPATVGDIDYDSLGFAVAKYLYVPQVIAEQFDYEEVANKIAEKMPAPQVTAVASAPVTAAVSDIDYDALGLSVAKNIYVPQAIAEEIDYDDLADKIAAKIPAPHVTAIPVENTAPVQAEVDYDLIAAKVAAVVSVQEVISPDYIASKVAEQIVIPAGGAPDIDVEELSRKVADKIAIPAVEATAAVDEDKLAFAIAEKLKEQEVTEEKTAALDIDEHALAQEIAEKLNFSLSDELIADAVVKNLAGAIDSDEIADCVAKRVGTISPEQFEITVDDDGCDSLAKSVESKLDYDVIAASISEKLYPAFMSRTTLDDLDTEEIARSISEKIDVGTINEDVIADKAAAALSNYMPEIDVDDIADKVVAGVINSMPVPNVDSNEISTKVVEGVMLAIAATPLVDGDDLTYKVTEGVIAGLTENTIVDHEMIADRVVEGVMSTLPDPIVNETEITEKIIEAVVAAIPEVNANIDEESLSTKVVETFMYALPENPIVDTEIIAFRVVEDVVQALTEIHMDEGDEIAKNVTEKVTEDTEERLSKIEEGLEEIKQALANGLVVTNEIAPAALEEEEEEPLAEELVTVSDLIGEEEPVEEVVEEIEPVEEVVEPEPVVEEDVMEELDETPADGEGDIVLDELDDISGGIDFANMMKYNRSFISRIIQGTDEQKNNYGQVKTALLSYNKVNSNIAWGAERFNKGRETIARFKIRGKTLCLYLALDPTEFETSVYHHVDVSDNKSMNGTPMMVKIKSPRGVKKAIRLIDIMLARRNGVKRHVAERDYAAMYPYETIEELIDDGLVKDVRKNK